MSKKRRKKILIKILKTLCVFMFLFTTSFPVGNAYSESEKGRSFFKRRPEVRSRLTAKRQKISDKKMKKERKDGSPLGASWQVVSQEEISRNIEKIKNVKLLSLDSNDLKVEAMSMDAQFNFLNINPSSSQMLNELARALEYDPRRISDYVHNVIEFKPFYGVRRGLETTVLQKVGSDAEQVLLMKELLGISGYDSEIIIADIEYYNLSEIQNWLGVDAVFSWSKISNIFWVSGADSVYYITELGEQVGVRARRFVIKVNIDEQDYYFDPAFKRHDNSVVFDFESALGYDRAELITSASQGAAIETDYVQHINESNIREKFQGYADNLIEYMKENYPNAAWDQVNGRGKIIPTFFEYTATPYLPSLWTVISTGDTISSELFSTVRLEYEGIDHTFNISDVTGKRLVITFNAQNQPELRLEGALIATGNVLTSNWHYYLMMSIDHPMSDLIVSNISLECGDYTYVVVSHVGGAKNDLLTHRQKILDEYISQGLDEESEEVLGETLNLVGLMYYQMFANSMELLQITSKSYIMEFNNFGIVGQKSSYYLDLPLNTIWIIYSNEEDYVLDPPYYSALLLISAYEHAVFEGMMGSNVPCVSMVKMFQIANQQGDKVFKTDSNNFQSIKPQLQNYFSDALSEIEYHINNGHTLFLPENGNLGLNDWSGAAYLVYWLNGGIGTYIYNGLSGGAGSFPVVASALSALENIVSTFIDPSEDPSISVPTSSDPVDMVNGSFLYDKTDMVLGGDVSNLGFSRSYNSMRSLKKKNMGYGWTHNYDINLLRTSDMNSVLGGSSLIESAAALATFYVVNDVYNHQNDIVKNMIVVLGYKWMVDQLIDNAFTIQAGSQLMKHIKLPDGSYSPPEGQTVNLVDNGNGTFSLVERFGAEMRFNSDDKIEKIIDNKGNEVNFTYSGEKLQTVADDYGHSITLNYNGDKIETVTDSAGRSVTYYYDGNEDMDYYIDVDGKTWRFGYDEHKMTTLTNPLDIVTATNVYDSFDRVQTQTVPRQTGTATYNFYFSGYRNIEEDPYGKKTIYYIDHKGRTYRVENELGYKMIKKFDGQNHEVEVTDPRGYTTIFDYNSDQNLEKVTNELLQETRYRYDASLRLKEFEDPLNHITQYEYYPDHLLKKVTDAELNNAQKTYYANGQAKTSTDARQTVSTVTYDAWGNPETSTTAAHPAIVYDYDHIGRMKTLTDQEGSTTAFEYYDSGKIKKRIDPLTKQELFFYDDAGQLQTKTDRNSDIITYDYTDSGKIETIIYPDDSTLSFTYDLHDILQTVTNSLGTTTYGYNDLYQVTSVNDALGFDVGYDYDEAGNIKKITYPENMDVIYSYDELNRLKTVTNWLSQVTTYYYDAAGRLDWVENFNGTITDYDYDDANRLIFLENKTATSGGDIISRYSYVLDGNGNREEVTQYELLMPNFSSIDLSLGYNAYRNRLMSAGLTSFFYDDEGQLFSKGVTTYDFDYDHRLKSINGAQATQFYYDGVGNRVKAVRNGVETQYIYDLAGNLLAEADDQGKITRYFIHGLGLLAMMTPDYELYTYHYDGNGNTIAMTDSSKEVVNSYAYTPYGLIANQDETIEQPFTFAGMVGIMEEVEGLYYMRARYYDPSVGRFISEDPIGFAGGDVNLYAYVGGSPMMFVDPSGLGGGDVFSNIGTTIGTVQGLINRAYDLQGRDPYAHQKSAYDFGKLVGNEYIAGGLRYVGEAGQFYYYSANDIYNRIRYQKPGKYQPYTLIGPGGVFDSANDIYNAYLGGRDSGSSGDYPISEFDPIQY